MIITSRDRDNGVGNLLTKICFSGLLHLSNNHRTDFLGGLGIRHQQATRLEKTFRTNKIALVAHIIDNDGRFAVLVFDPEWPVLHTLPYFLVSHLAANETFRVKNCILRIGVKGLFTTVTDSEVRVIYVDIYIEGSCIQSFMLSEADPRGSFLVALIVGDYGYSTAT